MASSKIVNSSAGQPAAPAQGWTRLIVAAYGPTLLASIGFGAVIPLIALQATALGASVGLAAAITGLTGIATLLFDLPAGVVAERLGEKRTIMLDVWVPNATTRRQNRPPTSQRPRLPSPAKRSPSPY